MRAVCTHADRCTGCPLISLDYPEQLARKSAVLVGALSLYPALARVAVESIVAADPITGYRVRAKLVVGASGSVGLFGPDDHEVIDLPECLVLTSAVAATVSALRALIRDPPSGTGPTLIPRADGGALMAMDVREARAARTRTLVSLVVDARRCGSPAEALAAAKAIVEADPSVATVALSKHAQGPRVLGGAPRTLVGPDEIEDHVGGIAHLAAPGAFVQAHRGQAEALHRATCASLGSVLGSLAGKTVYDLYGGSGAIALALAKAGARVTVVESYAPAARLAQLAGLEVAQDDAAIFRASGSVDAIVVDPPRRGLGARVRAAVARARPRAIAYVSCDAATLSRDLDAFLLLGYAPTRLRPFDMIPLSEHVETLALLEPAPRPPPRVLFENDEIVVVDKPAHEPTTPQGEHDSSLLERVRALPGCEAAAPLHRLDLETSGVNVFAKSGESAARWQRAFGGTRKRYLALVRGVTRPKGAVNRPLVDSGRQRPAHTRYRRLEVAGGHSLLEVDPREGKKHQIRRHLAGLGHPVVGDGRYGHSPTNRHFAEKHGLDRQLLHLWRLELGTPAGDQVIVISSPLPGAFIAVLKCSSFRGALPDHARNDQEL